MVSWENEVRHQEITRDIARSHARQKTDGHHECSGARTDTAVQSYLSYKVK